MKHFRRIIVVLCFVLVLFTACDFLLSLLEEEENPEENQVTDGNSGNGNPGNGNPGTGSPGGGSPGVNPDGSYNITYLNIEGAVNHSSNPGTYTAQSPVITLGAPVKSNVYFVCWRVGSSSGAAVSSIPKGSTGSKTFYAQWTTTEEYNIIAETNRVRTNPKKYADELQAELASVSNKSEYQAAISTLNAAASAPRSPVSFERGLYFAARAHAQDLIKTNTFSHNSSNGTDPFTRIQLYGSSYSTAGENIAAGSNQNTGAKMVKQWVLSPGHLSNILNANYTQLGASLMSGHPTYNWTSVQVFAKGFVSNPI